MKTAIPEWGGMAVPGKRLGPAAADHQHAQAQHTERGGSRFRNGAQGVFLHLVFCQRPQVQVKVVQSVFPRDAVRDVPGASGSVLGGEIDLVHGDAAEFDAGAAEGGKGGQRGGIIAQHGGNGDISAIVSIEQGKGLVRGITGKRLRFPGGGSSSPPIVVKASRAQGEVSGVCELKAYSFQILVIGSGVIGKQQACIRSRSDGQVGNGQRHRPRGGAAAGMHGYRGGRGNIQRISIASVIDGVIL